METPPKDTEERIARLGELYRTDPVAFEAMRRLLIEETIDGFPEQHRAKAYGLQLRLDAELGHYRDPVARMNRMVELFWEGFKDFQQAVSDPAGFTRERQGKKGEEGKVIPFPEKKTVH